MNQQYILDVYRNVKARELTPDPTRKDPSPLNYSRWLICENRVLRLYISEINTSHELKILSSYIMKMFALVLFDIYRSHFVTYGHAHILKVIQMTQQPSNNLRQVINFVIPDFFCNPENS